MSQAAVDFKGLIEAARARNGKRHFKGSFLEYLELLREEPRIAKFAHARIHDIITGPGFRVLNKEDNPKIRRLFRNEIVKSYKFFEDEFFGMERVLAKIIRYFRSASLKGEESRQVLYLVGPVGSGKSSLIEKIKEGLIRTEPYYVLEGCPMNEEPLHLVPHHLREQMEKILNAPRFSDQIRYHRQRLPSQQILDIFAGTGCLHSGFQLSCDNGVKLGNDLHAQSPGAAFPEMGDPFSCLGLFVDLRCVPAVHEDIGIDENATVHEFLPVGDILFQARLRGEASSRDNAAWTWNRNARSSFSRGAFLPPIWKRSFPARRPLLLPTGRPLHPG